MTIIFVIKFGWNWIEIVWEVAFEILAPIGCLGPMLTKTKKIVKFWKSKILKKEKNGLEIWRIGSFPQNLAWIHEAASEKFQLTAGHLRHDHKLCWQSQADQAKKDCETSNFVFLPYLLFLFSMIVNEGL